MSKISDDRVFSQAIRHAIANRKSLVEAYAGQGEWAESATKDADAFALLQEKKLSQLSDSELINARCCLIFAEQALDGFAWANHGKSSVEGRRALMLAERIRALRIRRWGLTRLEVLDDSHVRAK